MIDRSTRWPKAVLLWDTTAKDTFVATWVACYGMPSVITTDWGMQFTSATWSGWCEEYGMQRQIICK